MKYGITCFLLFLYCVSFGQIDSGNNTPLELKLDNPFETKSADDSNLPKLQYKSILDNENKPSRYSILPTKTETTKSILDTSTDLKTIGDDIKDKMNKEIADEGNWHDVSFGTFVVNTATIKIKTKDFADPDGDRVRFFLNSSVMYANELLETHFKTYVINLKEGSNSIDIMALNQGDAGPNTAYFAIFDENDNVVTSNEWNLKTGVSAKFVINYVKGL